MITTPKDLVPISQLLGELRRVSDQLALERSALDGVSYRTVYGAVLDGMLPARKQGREWHVSRGDFPAIVAALGVSAKRPVGRPRKSPPSNAAVAA